jgi:hypothetical protein
LKEKDNMDPQQTWQQVLEQLRTEISLAAFETWIRDAKLIDFSNGTYRASVQNAFAREWIIQNASDKFISALEQITGHRELNLEIIVSDQPDQPIRDPIEKPDKKTKSNLIIRPKEYDTVYDQVVRPHQQVVLPGYFRRHVREIGPKMAWMYVAFRQAAYMDGGRRKVKTGAFSGKQIATLCGISTRTYWRRIEKEKTWKALDGLVKRIESEPKWRLDTGEPRRMPLQYEVAMTLPLTSRDTQSLLSWLKENLEQFGGPEVVLEAACQTPMSELMPEDAQQSDWPPMSVRGIVYYLFENTMSVAKLEAYTSRLQNYIMPPKTDTIHISLFFLEHVLPHLSAGEAWMLTLLRDRCYVNKKTGEVRTEVILPGGYSEIAGWLGLKRPQTVWEWLRKGSPLSVFVSDREVDSQKGGRIFDVLLMDLPHEIIHIALNDRIWQAFETTMEALLGGDLDDAEAVNDKIIKIGWGYLPVFDSATVSIPIARLSDLDSATVSIGIARLSYDLSATVSIPIARLSYDLSATVRVKITSLTSFKPPHNHLKDTSTTTSPPTAAQMTGRETAKEKLDSVVLGDRFDLSVLFSLNNVNPTSRKELQRKEASPLAFVSHLLYAASPAGSTIENPISYTVNQLKHDPKTGAGAEYDQLARLKPEKLAGLVAKALDDSYQSQRGRRVLGYADALTGHAAWDNVMLNAPQLALSELGLALFGVRLIDRTETTVTIQSTHEQT